MRKVLEIVSKDLYAIFTDRNLLLIMLVTPFMLALVITLAFSRFFTAPGEEDTAPALNIPVAIVNADDGELSRQIVSLFVPPADASAEVLDTNPIFRLTDAVLEPDEAAARAGVDAGRYAVAVLIPAGFSEALTASAANAGTLSRTSLTLYENGASPTSSSIVQDAVQQITDSIAARSVAISASVSALAELAQSDPAVGLSILPALGSLDFAGAIDAAGDPFASATATQETEDAQAQSFNPLVFFGAGQAIFFMTFTALGGTANILEERRDGTLSRLFTTPTSRATILTGKLLGTFCACVLQVVLLFIALTVVGSLFSGQLQIIWGTNLLLIALVIFAASFALCGIAAVLVAIVRTPEQANVIGGVLALALGVLGGVFFNLASTPLAPLAQITPNYWGVNAFTKLSQGNTDIGLNLMVLVGFGLVLYTLGIALFSRRFAVE
jgi:ABC-2 type transport system permease protein